MRVLLLDTDLFATVGGGQTFYRNVILKNPDIDFFYLKQNEPSTATRPVNAHPIELREHYPWTALLNFNDINVPYWTQSLYLKANNIAASVANKSFDVVDFPDYNPIGLFLRSALQSHGVNVGRIAISMHGLISTTNALNWEGTGVPCRVTRLTEELQFATADLRYFISERYQSECYALSRLPSHYVDPLHLFSPSRKNRYERKSAAPCINFVGRTEKRKGPHLFLQMLWWLSPGSYSSASIIGPPCLGSSGTPSTQTIEKMRSARGLDVRILGSMNSSELEELFASNSITCVPSIYDTFNLVALESLFAGCPAIIGSGAGIVDYLHDRFPKIRFEILDTKCFFASIPPIEALLENYDDYRADLSTALAESDYTPQGPAVRDVYESTPARDRSISDQIDDWYLRMQKRSRKIIC